MNERTISSTTVYDGKILKVNVDKVELSDGRTSTREEVLHGGGACVLAVDGGRIPLVSQFRYAYGKEILELPAGKLEKGEDPLIAAGRELEEEVGLRAKNLTKIAEVFPSPGYTNEVIHIFYATEFEKTAQKLDDGEFLSVAYFTPEELFEMVDRGVICDGKTLVAVYYLKSLMLQKKV